MGRVLYIHAAGVRREGGLLPADQGGGLPSPRKNQECTTQVRITCHIGTVEMTVYHKVGTQQ